MINLTLNTEEAEYTLEGLRDTISSAIGATYNGDPDDRPQLKREIESLREVIVRLKVAIAETSDRR